MGFGGGKAAKVHPQTGPQFQTASSTKPVTWARGMSRLFPNIIDYTDFKAHKHKQTAGKGFGQKVTTYSYTATLVMELCEGVIDGVERGWLDKGEVADAGEFGFTIFTGTTPQAPWGYMAAAHPDHALSYPGTAYAAKANAELGDAAQIGMYSWEVRAGLYATAPGGSPDAECAQCVLDFLTDTISGAVFPAGFIDMDQLFSTADAAAPGDSTYQTYCQAMGFGLSPALDEQESASDILERWAQITNTAPVWTGYSFKMIPFADEAVTGNGVTFLPDTDVRFDLTDSDYNDGGSKGTIEETISDPADAKNMVKLEIRDRANAYNPVPIPWQDQVSIETLGRREGEVIDGHEICDVAMGGKVVALIGQRIVNIRNGYRFPLDARFAVLEPMDVVTLSGGQLGLQALPVRILTIEEDEDDNLTIEAEEFPGAVNHTTTTAGAGGTPEVVNSLVAPSDVNPPLIFEPPAALTGGVAQVWAAVSGGDGTTADPDWGGCTVYASSDDVTYQAIGVISEPARMGVTAGALAAYALANPQGSTVAVDLAMSAGELQDVTEDEAAAAASLSYVENAGGGNGEFFSYRDATLTGSYAYTIGGSLYRALYGTPGGLHALGSRFARLDGNIFRYDLPPAWIGQTLYFKFTSFNLFGSAEQDLADVASYTFTPTGVGLGGGSSNSTASTAGAISAGQICHLYSAAGVATVEKANATDLTKPANCFVLADVGAGLDAQIYFAGQFVTGLAGLTPGATYYLDTTAGLITDDVSGFAAGAGSQVVGVAVSATTLFFDPQPMFGL